MKKSVIIYLISVIFAYTLNAQDTRKYDIFTPNGSPVTTWLMTESSLQVRQGFDYDYTNAYPNAQKIITFNGLSSTRRFNCHGYAWLYVERGVTRWIGYSVTTEEDIYMSDGSYAKVSQATYPGKVSWGSGDHSAVTTSQPGIVISKWNEWPLMQHALNYSPFGSSNLKYYKGIPIISGVNGLLIHSDQTYYLYSPPAGTITWETSGNKFTVSPTTGSSTTITSTNTGTGTLTAKVNGTVVATKSITVSPIPALGPMTGPSVVQPGQTYVSYRLNLVQGQGLVYNWGSSEGILTEVGVIGDSEGLFNVSSSSGAGTDTVHCTVKTNNGTTVGVFYMNVSIEY